MPDDLKKKDAKYYQKLLKEKDKLEKEALIERLKKRDQMQKQPGGHLLQAESNSEFKSIDDFKAMVPELREISRQKYLKHRVEQQMDLYKRNLDDERRIFGEENLTEAERRINEINNEIYKLAQSRQTNDDLERTEFYKLPGQDLDQNDGNKKSRH